MKFYYTNARMNGKTLLLAGPFLTAQEAGNMIDVCGPMLVKDEPTSEFASFGVMECNGFAGYGHYNDILKQHGVHMPFVSN